MHSTRFVGVLVLAGVIAGGCAPETEEAEAAGAPAESAAQVDPALLGGLSWRSIGPAMFAGRVSDVAGVPAEPDILYVAASSSGLFRSTNGGTTFESIFDDAGTLSIGAIALHPDDPDVVWVGTGEGAVRNSISYGDGIYRTDDGGATWRHLGLADTERFSRIAVHPNDPDVVFAAAMGHAFGPNEERGIYRTTDGGRSWQRVLFTNATSGASDVAIDPADPDIVYAGMYDYLRRPWHFRSGGPGSGLYRSSDGGTTWTKLTDPALDNGLPGAGVIGRVGVSVHRADPRVVYALVESEEEGELWRSDDRGRTWRMVSDERRLNNRPFYYTQVRADPVDPDRVYTLAGSFSVSTDGGRTFRGTGGSMFGDHHALWIDPTDPGRLLSGTDGGFWISNDFGRHWDFLNNMPMAQAYHLGVDMAEPYHVLGGFQDHEIWRGPNEKWNRVGVREGDWVRLRYMADGMYTIPDPRDPDVIYYNGHFGDITRIDLANADERYIQPYPPGPHGGPAALEEYRFNWNSPIHMSPSDPDVLYFGGNVLFRTRDRGESWEVISPDLTTDDPDKQGLSGGPITPDNTRAEVHCTILSIAESPVDPRVIWVGTDDGNVQVTGDGGRTWTNVAPNIEGAPPFSWVASVRASHVEAGTAYVAIDQHRMDDFAPYVFVTRDYGATWTRIDEGLRGYVHVVMEDPRQPDLLYAGTEVGVFASFDRGATWTDLRLGLPPLAVVDMTVHPRDNDLVIATHARGFYILDDVGPLQHLAAASRRPVELFPVQPPVRYVPASDVSVIGDRAWVAPNQPYGALISYWVGEGREPPDAARIDIVTLEGDTIRTLTGPVRPGVNRVVWDLGERSACVAGAPGIASRPGSGASTQAGVRRAAMQSAGARGDPGTWVRAVPGHYTVWLTLGGETLERPLRVRRDPTHPTGTDEMIVWRTAALRIERMECTIDEAADRVRALDRELEARLEAATEPALRARVEAVRAELRPVLLGLVGDVHDPGHVNLAGRVGWLTIQVGGYPGAPTAAQAEWIDRWARDTEGYAARLDSVAAGSVAELDRQLRAAGLEGLAFEN